VSGFLKPLITTDMTYAEFLQCKFKHIQSSGFDVHEDYLNAKLFDFQKYIVRKSLQYGKFAIFADCGLGKTAMQLEWANQVVKNTQRPVLILCPLAVSGQTIEEGKKFDIEVKRYQRTFPVIDSGIYIANYEQLNNIDCHEFGGVVLDESSILKNFTGSIKQQLISSFQNTPYKLCCTATPSPNDDMEMCNHAEFLNQGRRDQILSMYFTHDGGETNKWRLKGHAKKMFWNYVKTWAIMMGSPADLGFDGSSYELPKLNIIDKVIQVPVKNGKMFNDIAINALNYNDELRKTLTQRLTEVASIVNNSSENFIIWVKQNVEAQWLLEQIPGSIEVRGSEDPNVKEKKLLGFAHNEYRVLITKTKIAQYGLNFQNCHNQIFASVDFSFESLYQAIRRSYRFGQKHSVNIYLITTDTMRNVITAIKNKQEQFEIMKYHLTNN
jgi:hypothetical protein